MTAGWLGLMASVTIMVAAMGLGAFIASKKLHPQRVEVRNIQK